MTIQVNGFTTSGEGLTSGTDSYTIYTTVDIRPLVNTVVNGVKYEPTYVNMGWPSYHDEQQTDSQIMLDKLVQLISTRAQPVILGGVQSGVTVPAGATDESGLPVAALTGTVYSISFTLNHAQAWFTNNPKITGAIAGVANYNQYNANLAGSINGLSGPGANYKTFVTASATPANINTVVVPTGSSYPNLIPAIPYTLASGPVNPAV